MQVNVPDPMTLTCGAVAPGLSARQDDHTIPAAPRRAVTLWMPDLSVFLALLTLVWSLFVFDGWHMLFRDSDTGWHIRTGERILDSRSLPATDPYSFTRSEARWMDWEWAADVLSGAAHRYAGLRGVAALFGAAVAACSLLWVRLTWAAGGDFLLACAFAFPMLSTVNMHWLARPHVFGWLLLLGWLIWMERRGESLTLWTGLAAAAFGAVWANVHGSFFLAPVIACLYAVGPAVKKLLWEDVGEAPGPRRTLSAPLWVRPAGLAVCFAAGTVVNPFGVGLHAHVFGYLTDSELLARVGEFQSFNFHAGGAGWILVTLMLSLVGGVLAVANRRPEHALVMVLFVAIALRSARGLPVLALCILPLANANIAMALGRAQGLRTKIRLGLDRFLGYSRGLRELDRGLSGFALIAVIAAVMASVPAQAGFPANEFPVEAAEAVARLPETARLLAPDKFGGYLIYRFSGTRKVFFDGRSDFYGPAFMKEYLRLMEARPGWREITGRYRFTHALLPPDSPLLAALDSSGWHAIHKDGTATLLAGPE